MISPSCCGPNTSWQAKRLLGKGSKANDTSSASSLTIFTVMVMRPRNSAGPKIGPKNTKQKAIPVSAVIAARGSGDADPQQPAVAFAAARGLALSAAIAQAAREIRVRGCEDHFVERFSRPLLRLSRKADQLAYGTEYAEGQELMNEAVRRAMIAAAGITEDGRTGRAWPKGVHIVAFLSMTMRGLAK